MKSKKFLAIILSAVIFAGCEKKTAEQAELAVEQKVALKNELRDFLFVGNSGKENSLFNYNFEKDTITLFWRQERQTIVNFSYSPDKKNAFITTVSSFGKQGVFPFVRNVRVYHYDSNSRKISKIKNLKHGVQLFTLWNGDELFELTINSVDSTIANYIEQRKNIYSAKGKHVETEKQIFDLLTDGYPPPPQQKFSLISPGAKYSFAFNDDKEVKIKIDNSWTTITTIEKPIADIGWTDNDEYLVFSCADVSPNNTTLHDKKPNTSEIYVYSCAEQKIVYENKGGGLRNFIISGNLLIYDLNFSKDAAIIIYDLTSKKEKILTLKNGCGVKNIPLPPDYDA